MGKQIFRKKSLDLISAPEQLNDIICVFNPSVWFVLLTIAVFLAGALVWAFAARLDAHVGGVAVVRDGVAVCYVSEEDAPLVSAGLTVRIGDTECKVLSVAKEPVPIVAGAAPFSDYFLHLGGFREGQWVCAVVLDAKAAADGVHAARIIVGEIAPISFVLG